ncbi:MAG: hypothetical protein MUW56_06825 [Chryseobacterium sp.]|uniref:hypothetical protein n=1 Tax=Chryseobacterium sp. TaxID=1871047 RepID=UPI0025BC78DB|nr:hypothetical protein [Chryseobacterium sp.]MCJ7933346.1 hypothetical protein [Chryseobacterium sp.]
MPNKYPEIPNTKVTQRLIKIDFTVTRSTFSASRNKEIKAYPIPRNNPTHQVAKNPMIPTLILAG